jgi:hypothetical protein
MHLTAHLWTGASAPSEYVIYKVFYKGLGWTPEEFRRQRPQDIYQILAMVNVETKVANRRGQHGKRS